MNQSHSRVAVISQVCKSIYQIQYFRESFKTLQLIYLLIIKKNDSLFFLHIKQDEKVGFFYHIV